MKIKQYLTFILPITLLIWTSNSFAIGLGFTSASGNEKWSTNNTNTSDSDHDVSATGIMFDTNVAKNRLFNYRLTYQNEENKSSNGSFKYEGYAIANDFGFGVFKNEWVRLWIGPRFTTTVYDTVSVNNVQRGTDVVGIAYGPVIGINVNFPQVVSLSITTGRMIGGGYIGNIDNFGTSIFGDDVDVDVKSSFLNISVVFRIRDNY